MAFPFSHVCNLLQQIADLPTRRKKKAVIDQIIQKWFGRHQTALQAMSDDSGVALLSTLLPDLRTDRVYGLQAPSLQRIIARALCLGHSRVAELARWTQRSLSGDLLDLGDCVERVLEATPNSTNPRNPISVEEVDSVLQGVAARSRFSAPSVQEARETATLHELYIRLDARDAKWLTRLVLKDYRPVQLDAIVVTRAFHPQLPLVLRVRSNLTAAVQSLASPEHAFTPRLGIKVGRQLWAKAHSVRHCVAMGDDRRSKRRPMSCERKLDGEYVQVHVDLSKGLEGCLQLFSKSGKDSTQDRAKLHASIRASLRLDSPDCPLSQGCVLEGEMLAYDDRTGKLLDFDAIRKHVTRGGTRLYSTTADSPYEHLMIVYYDILFIDGESLLATAHSERWRRLEQLIVCCPGHAELVPRQVIDFGRRAAKKELAQLFAHCIAANQEGLVVKPDDQPYFAFFEKPAEWHPCAIKLKKEYGNHFGDIGDLAVIGARYDAVAAKTYPQSLPGLRWTHFYLGCLDTGRGAARPHFVVTNVIQLSQKLMRTFSTHCRPRTKEWQEKDSAPFDLAPIEPGLDGGHGPTVLFVDMPVADVRCFGFHRPGYGHFWSPRFASATKFHFDRTFRDCLTFADIQDIAEEEARRKMMAEVVHGNVGQDMSEVDDELDQEIARFAAELRHDDPGDSSSSWTSQSSTYPETPQSITSAGKNDSQDSSGISSEDEQANNFVSSVPSLNDDRSLVDSEHRKRRACDVETLFRAVSPPMLKRQKKK